MPRIYDSASNPLDYCKRDFPASEADARALFGTANVGEGPDGRGDCFSYNDEHPDYGQDEYTCEACGRSLTERDN